MKITEIQVVPFETTVDRISFGQLISDYPVVQTLTRVLTDEGVEGCYFGGHFHGDQDGLLPGDQALIRDFLGPFLTGRDPLDRAEIWRQLWAAKLPENVCSVIDLALWDLAGRASGLPVHKLLGGARDKVKAYASSFNNLGRPEDYAAHAAECQRQGTAPTRSIPTTTGTPPPVSRRCRDRRTWTGTSRRAARCGRRSGTRWC